MKLYLMADEENMLQRWESILAHANPQAVSHLHLNGEVPAIIMILDRMLEAMDNPESVFISSARVFVLSSTPGYVDAQRYLGLGAMGYGNALMHESHLLSAHQALREGKVWLLPDFITRMIDQIREIGNKGEAPPPLLDSLTQREKEVALMLGNGATHHEISGELDITIRTVKAHAAAIYQKLGVKDRLALSLLLHR